MNDMSATVLAKTDQLNADDMIGITKTITVTGVKIIPGEQPVTIAFDGDKGKPYKPGKSMRRVLVQLWGADANAYVGRSMTLYRDSKVKFGGLDVGGIRISHMSHIASNMTMALTVTKGQKGAFTVKPLKTEQPAQSASKPATQPQAEQPRQSLGNRVDAALAAIPKADTLAKLAKLHENASGLLKDLEAAKQLDRRDRLSEAFSKARADLEDAEREPPPSDDVPFPSDDDFRGDRP